jgi:hypothetical protein
MHGINILARVAGAVAIAALATATAEAKVWEFSYSGGGYFASGEFITGSGASSYTVIGVSGAANGSTITGLSTYGSADQLLFYPKTDSYVDYYGISFETASGVAYNIFYSNSENWVSPTNAVPYEPLTLSVTPAPEPSTWAMLLVGFGGLSFAAFRRSRQSVSVAA